MTRADSILRAGIEGLRAIFFCFAAAGRLPHGAIAAGVNPESRKRTSVPPGTSKHLLINLAPAVAGVSSNTHLPFSTTAADGMTPNSVGIYARTIVTAEPPSNHRTGHGRLPWRS